VNNTKPKAVLQEKIYATIKISNRISISIRSSHKKTRFSVLIETFSLSGLRIYHRLGTYNHQTNFLT